METRILTLSEEAIAQAAALLRSGDLVIFPTDTVYGVGALITHPQAVARLYRVKDRPGEKAIPLLIADPEDLEQAVTKVTPAARRLIACFWPGGLTLVLPKRPEVPAEVSPGPTVAVRLPDHGGIRALIRAAGAPLAATSANRSGQPSPRTAQEALAQLGGRVPLILDGGPCPGGVPSTVVDCTVDPPRLLREGAIPASEIRRELGFLRGEQ